MELVALRQEKKRLLHQKELLTSLCVPTTVEQSRLSCSPVLEVDQASRTQACRMAGNGMHVPTAGAFMLAACLGLVKI